MLCPACNDTYVNYAEDCEHDGCPVQALSKAEARCERLEADCAAKDAALEWALDILDINDRMITQEMGADCDWRVDAAAKAKARRALQDNPGAALLAVVKAAREEIEARTWDSMSKLRQALANLDGQKEKSNG